MKHLNKLANVISGKGKDTKTLLLRSSNTGTERGPISGRSLCKLLAIYTAVFAMFFWGIHSGVGQFWDWSFPYFGDQMDTLFSSKASSWTSSNTGSPLGYASDYFVRFVVSILGFLPPELVRYGLLVLVFATGALGVYMLARRYTSNGLALLIGLVAFINPAIFYKYTAGHFNYMVSLVLFIYLLYFLFYKFNKDLRSAVIVGLFFGLIGTQIQFFIIGGIFLAVYFLFNRQQVALKYVLVMLLIPLLLNAVWLANFMSGATSAADTGAAAAKVSFKALSGSDFLSIFTFSFSKATLLTKFYAFYELLWNTALFIFMLWLLVREKQKQTSDIVLLVFLSVMIFMATGLYQAINLGPITMLYPMLREVGHFAPVIVLAALLITARLIRTSKWRWVLSGILVVSLLTVGIKFQYFSQGYSFADARKAFAPFKEFADSDQTPYRILAYPFFDQYSFKDLPKDPPGTLPLKNSGHDSFAAFSHQQYIPNAIAPHTFQESIQYKLLQDYDITVLRPYNIKYIFDFSAIYESNYERFVPPTVYNNDLSLIKNDPHFFDKLIAANPGKLRRVNDRILEVKDYLPRIGTTAGMFALPDDAQTNKISAFTSGALDTPLDYVTDSHGIEAFTTTLTPLFGSPREVRVDPETETFEQTLTPKASNNKSTLYVDRLRETVFYEVRGEQLTVYTESTGQLSVNGRLLYSGDGSRRIISQTPLEKNKTYYATFKGKTVALGTANTAQTGRLGIGSEGDAVAVFVGEGANIIANTSFEDELWQPKVTDCNNYDFDHNANIGMKQTAETAKDGGHALELNARRHDACTFTEVPMQANSDYLLSYAYQSPNAKTASFYLGYTNDNKGFARGSHTIANDKWGTYSQIVRTPDRRGNARLYLYALEQENQNTVNRYDAVTLVQLKKVQRATIPSISEPYQAIPLPAGNTHQFAMTGSGQQFDNLIANGSFEKGSWQRSVSDCRNYDNKGNIAMRLDTSNKTDGRQSLELRAQRHDACVRTTTNITGGTEYQLAFDYRGQKGKYYGYTVSFDDPENTVQRKQVQVSSNGKWSQANIRLETPADATTATIYLYALEPADRSENVIQYDNVRLTELPDFADRFYVVEEPAETLYTPQNVTFEGEDPARKTIRIAGASTPFFTYVSETYHPRWRLILDTNQTSGPIGSWWPGAPASSAGKHITVSNYLNGWLVDPAAICEPHGKLRSGCTKNSDGSYNMELVVEFAPQRWFLVAAATSWLTLIGCIVYLVCSHGRHMPTYRLLSYKEWHSIIRRWK